MAKKSGQVPTIIIDSKKHTEKTLSEREARKIPYLISASEGDNEPTVYGFNSVVAMEEWLGKRNLLDQYNRGEKLIRRAKRTLTPDEEAEISRIQEAAVSEETKRLNTAMSKEGIKGGETEKLRRLLTEYDPLRGPIIHSAILWEHAHQGGSVRVLPSGWCYQNFAWFNFNDVTSSVLNLGAVIALYQDVRFRGQRRVTIWGFPFTGYVSNFSDWPFYFNDMASSAVVF